jgi:hypothetical protein
LTVPDDIRVYPTQRADGTMIVMLVNLGDSERLLELHIARETAMAEATLSTTRADDLDADALIEEQPRIVGADDAGSFSLRLPPWSISLLEGAGVG